MKVYKLEVLIIDEDVESIKDAIDIIDATRYPNHTYVTAVSCIEADVDWHDDHPLNFGETMKQEMDRIFSKECE